MTRFFVLFAFLGLFVFIDRPAQGEHFGAVSFTLQNGLIVPVRSDLPDNFKSIRIDGLGGLRLAPSWGSMILEAPGHQGARLDRISDRAWVLDEGILEIISDTPIEIRVGAAAVTGEGRISITRIPDVESIIRVFDGSAAVRGENQDVRIGALEAVRIPPAGPLKREYLPPAPAMSAIPAFSADPLTLTVQPADERILDGAVQIEWSDNEIFWETGRRCFFSPHEPAVLAGLPAGKIYLRARSVSRAGLAGPAGKIFSTTVLAATPHLTDAPILQSGTLAGRLNPPIGPLTVRWGNERTSTDSAGAFEFRPSGQLGLTIADLLVDLPGGTLQVPAPMTFLSDPDRLSYFFPYLSPDPAAQVFIRSKSILVRNLSADAGTMLDGIPLDIGDTVLLVPHTARRRLKLTGTDTPYEITISQDNEGPRILNVSLETRGAAERFYVLADVVDLGIGLQLPARAVFESDVGERLEISLERISELRLEGRADASALVASRKARSSVWWVRVHVEDLLGNVTRYEKAVYHKRQKKFASIGLKDLVRIWKNKL